MTSTTDTGTGTEPNALRQVLAAASDLYTAPPRRATAVSYVERRGIRARMIPDEWPLGHARPGWTSLTDTLRSRGYADELLVAAGLSKVSSRGTLIDVFRDRLVLPVCDADGCVAGFVGRDLSGSPLAPKYLNTRETPLFHKAELLYGLGEARTATPGAFRPVLVEGPLDVLAVVARTAGSSDRDLLPVASCGTAFSTAQAQVIAAIAASTGVPVVVAMDGDAAGRSASVKAGERLRLAGAQARVAILANGLDPAEYLSDPSHDLAPFRHQDALPLLTVQIEQAIAAQGENIQWVEGKIAAARAIADHLPRRAGPASRRLVPAVLDIAPATFLAITGTALRDSHALPPHGHPFGDLLRTAAELGPLHTAVPRPPESTVAQARHQTMTV